MGVALLWPTLGFWASLFCITPSLSLFFSSFCSPFGTNLGFFPPSFHFPLYFHSHFSLMELSLHLAYLHFPV